jgi:DNA-binding response OmpR family regulator
MLTHGRLRLDTETLRVTWDWQDVPLTATELGVLRTLLARPGRVFSHDELMDRAHASERVVSDRTIDSHVRRRRLLRRSRRVTRWMRRLSSGLYPPNRPWCSFSRRASGAGQDDKS